LDRGGIKYTCKSPPAKKVKGYCQQKDEGRGKKGTVPVPRKKNEKDCSPEILCIVDSGALGLGREGKESMVAI